MEVTRRRIISMALGLITIYSIELVRSRCIECKSTDFVYYIIGLYFLITGAGPGKAVIIFEKIAEKIEGFTISTKSNGKE